MSTEKDQSVPFRKRKKRKVQFTEKNKVRYFDQQHAAHHFEDEESADMIQNSTVETDSESNHNQAPKCTENVQRDEDGEEDDELKFKSDDPLYDASMDAIDEDYMKHKYSDQTALQSDCTVCCANCFVFISYVAEKNTKYKNSYKCFSVENCEVDESKTIASSHRHRVFCRNCNTQIGTREGITYLSNKDGEEQTAQGTERNNNHHANVGNESEIWTLVSSDFSSLRAPTVDADNIDGFDTSNPENEAPDDNDSDDEASSLHTAKDNHVYLYHLTNVLPGMI